MSTLLDGLKIFELIQGWFVFAQQFALPFMSRLMYFITISARSNQEALLEFGWESRKQNTQVHPCAGSLSVHWAGL